MLQVGYCVFQALAAICDFIMQRFIIYALCSRDLCKSSFRPSVFFHPAGSPVVGLDGAVCPSTILRRIGAIVVDTIDRQSLGGFTHIGKKILVVFHPAFANRDASSAISRICRTLLAVTSFSHSPIDPIRSIFKSLFRVSPFRVLATRLAPLRPPGPKRGKIHDLFVAAFAAALNHSTDLTPFADGSAFMQNGPTPITVARGDADFFVRCHLGRIRLNYFSIKPGSHITEIAHD